PANTECWRPSQPTLNQRNLNRWKLRRLGLPAWGCLLALVLGLSDAAAQSKMHLKISGVPLVLQSYQAWTATTPWDKIEKFDAPNANRQTVELILQMQALKAGGVDPEIELISAPNLERALVEVEVGRVDLTAETMWDREINETVLFKTDAVLRDGDFQKGLYVMPGNDRALKATSLEDVHNLVGLTVATWAHDLDTLHDLGAKSIEKAPTSENMFLMLQKKRADFTLLEFSAKADLSTELAGVTLVPVPNCKVILRGSRSWVVSKASPHAQQIYDALVKGEKILRDQGRIERAFQESGFINGKVSTWKRLN
ncbi:MAG TPA: hypothetical protein VF988_14960, partial [Verrucomicrobiae bacterium]